MSLPVDPIDPLPTSPLLRSYTYHSPISAVTRERYQLPSDDDVAAAVATRQELPAAGVDASAVASGSDSQGGEDGVAEGSSSKGKEKERWVMGIDEAGRGPVLGPMVYACAFAPLSFSETLDGLGFDDSKALSHDTRNHLFSLFKNPLAEGDADRYHELHYATRVLSPQDISTNMMRGVSPINLNKQAEDATVLLISEVLARGIDLAECYVDALGACGPYQAKLSALFPTISFTVQPKADSIYKIVGAASIAAKITRDRWITHWLHPEAGLPYKLKLADEPAPKKRKAAVSAGKGGGKGKKGKVAEDEDEEAEAEEADDEPAEAEEADDEPDEAEEEEAKVVVENISGMDDLVEVLMGSGYPSDPTTKAYLQSTLDPIFGYPSLVRFSWSTVKVILEKGGKEVHWIDQKGGGGKKFFSASREAIADRERVRLWAEVGLKSVGEL